MTEKAGIRDRHLRPNLETPIRQLVCGATARSVTLATSARATRLSISYGDSAKHWTTKLGLQDIWFSGDGPRSRLRITNRIAAMIAMTVFLTSSIGIQ
jgi:hypothetical protein